jgi:hypothetical protein
VIRRTAAINHDNKGRFWKLARLQHCQIIFASPALQRQLKQPFVNQNRSLFGLPFGQLRGQTTWLDLLVASWLGFRQWLNSGCELSEMTARPTAAPRANHRKRGSPKPARKTQRLGVRSNLQNQGHARPGQPARAPRRAQLPIFCAEVFHRNEPRSTAAWCQGIRVVSGWLIQGRGPASPVLASGARAAGGKVEF